ncbi:signal-regulatory protein beta-1-like [Pantherophis guttatus]|uniref:Signal-regulatory protein beta-1-like n=1 Tax=Pantherophis guttatus TaxID=94885 RepID=A0ABM3YYB3_PANGU|nr:signal-regulatory protein beta-1-like [Pantherophis guttatus]
MAALRSFKRIPGPLHQLLLLLLLLLPWDLVVTGQNIEITQLPEIVLVKAGEDLTLRCTFTGGFLPGGVRWYKGLDRNKTPIYSDKQGSSNRGVRVIPGSNTDFSINIRNIRPEDAGTYYCVKFRAGNPERELASGKGTLVSVIAKPSQPLIRGPTRRITVGSLASFDCSSNGFSPREITVSWLKDGKEKQVDQISNLDSDGTESMSYKVESRLIIPLEQGDVKSQLTCQIQHRSLDSPLQQTFALRDVISVPPKVHLEINPPPPIQLNSSVTVTCNAESFYPDGATMELFPKDAPSRKGTVAPSILNPDGTFSLKSNLEMMATEDREFSMFLCQVQHDSQPLVNKTTTLFITQELEGNPPSPLQLSPYVLYIAFFLGKVAAVLLISSFFLIKKIRCSCQN